MLTKRFPPKFAIANGFVIGSMPKILQMTTADGEKKTRAIAEHELSDLLKAMMAPVRPYGSIFSYAGEICIYDEQYIHVLNNLIY
jgi:hypothetical protein